MQKTIPVKDLKDTARVTELCEQADEPVIVTRNGVTSMYLVNPRTMERMQQAMAMQSLYARLEHSEAQIARGRRHRFRRRHGRAEEALWPIERLKPPISCRMWTRS